MVFLANLVGLQPTGRHLPLADPQNEQPEIMPAADSATREMPRPRAARSSPRAQRVGRMPRSPPPRVAAAPAPAPLSAAAAEVVEDGIRLMQWGRKWHELGELISRLPARPSVGETRRILRTHRARIEAGAAASAAAHQ
jgi:hypothetical protein